MRSLIPLALLASFAAPGWADEPPAKSPQEAGEPAPKLEVESKDLDFGEIVHGATTTLKVALKNTGQAPLEIRQVKPSCGCTVADFPRVVAPGTAGELSLEFDSAERPPGYQSFRITIYTNDASQKDRGSYCTILNLRGEVRTLFRKAPHGAFFGEVIQGVEAKPRVVKVYGLGAAKQGFSLELASEPPPYVKVSITPWASPDGRRRGQEVKVALSPDTPLGSFQIPLEFRTNVKEQPTLRVMCAALVNTRITGPPTVFFGDLERLAGGSRTIVVERRDGLDGLPLIKARYDAKVLAVSWKEIGPRRLEVELTVRPGVAPGPLTAQVDLLFDDPHQPLLTIPVSGRVLPQVAAEPRVVLLPASAEVGAVVARVKVTPRPGKATLEPAECGLSARLVEGAVEVVCAKELPKQEVFLVIHTGVLGEEQTRVPLVPR